MPLILLPILLLLAAGLALLLIHRIKPDFGYFWIASVVVSLAAWGGLLALRWQTPLFFSMNLWEQIGFQVSFPLFQLDPFSWPYAFSLASLVAAVILTAPVRISRGSNPVSWANGLVAGGLALMAILAANPLTLILAWTGLDILELAYQLKNAPDNPSSRRAVISFAIGMAGTLLAVWAMLVSQSEGLPLSFSSMTPDASQFLVLAAGVRLAIFPYLVSFRQEIPAQRGISALMKLAAPCASLVLLARLPVVPFSTGVSTLIFTLTLAALLYSSVRWFVSSDEIAGRPDWVAGFSALVLVCLLRGRPDVSPALGSAMLLGGGLLSLFTARQARLLFLPLIGFLGLTGIIFTPTSAGWAGLWIEPFQFVNAIIVIGYSLLLGGFLRHTLRQDENQEEIDRWVQIIYPAGLIVIVMTFVLTAFWAVQQYGLHTFWAGPVISTVLAFFWLGLRSWLEKDQPVQSLLKSIGRMIGTAFSFVINLNWLYKLVGFIFVVMRQFVFWFTGILEGDGGVLWAILVVLLIITLLRPGEMP